MVLIVYIIIIRLNGGANKRGVPVSGRIYFIRKNKKTL